jgi:oxygen-dependent protoporphyrinogen oxidase
MQKDIVIIGAGLTGLATAHYLKKAGLSVAIIEKENRTGGVINSHHEKGFLFESGPNTGVISWPEVAELFEELYPGCKLVTANSKAKRRLIWKGKKWHAIPSEPVSAISTPLYTLKDKFKILGEPWRKPGTNPMENLSDFVKRRLGKSFLDYTVDPFVSGVYAGKTDYLVPKYALPKLYNLEQQHGSFIKGSIAKAKEKKNNPRLQKANGDVFSTEGGLHSLTNALTNSVGNENIFTACSDTNIKPHEKGYLTKTNNNGETIEIESKYVVSTVGAYALPGLLPFISEETLKPITNLQYAKIVQVILGYNKWTGCDIKAFGGLVPSIEKRSILGVLFTSSFFEGRTPEGGALLSVFMSGTRMPEQYNMSDDEIIGILKKEIPDMMKLDSFNPDMIRIFRHQHAIAQYGADSKERFETIEKLEQEYPGLILAGGMRNGIGMADRIKQAATIANAISGQ